MFAVSLVVLAAAAFLFSYLNWRSSTGVGIMASGSLLMKVDQFGCLYKSLEQLEQPVVGVGVVALYLHWWHPAGLPACRAFKPWTTLVKKSMCTL